MAATAVLSLDAWNDLLGRINALVANPPEGCDPLQELPLVQAPHKWSETDISQARAKLTEICSDNVFHAPSIGKWRQEIIDELEEAIDKGWCNCEPEIPCCIPQGSGTVWMEGPGGGYWVTIPYWQVIEQYLYGNIDYSQAEAALPDGVMARIVACYPGSSGNISHSYHHDHWGNCVYQDYWTDGSKRGDEYWNTCSNTESEVTDLGRLPSISSSYGGGTVVGDTNYYGSPMFCSQWMYDYIEGRWYQSCWIGYFEVDAYWYDFANWNSFSCS